MVEGEPIPELTRPCPHCAEPILLAATKCKHCGEYLGRHAHTTRQSVNTNVKQGALIGAVTCLTVGIVLMWLTMWSFLLYSPLFFAAFVLSIVAMAQRRVAGGVIMLLLTVAVPPLLFLVLGAIRTADFAEKLPDPKGLFAPPQPAPANNADAPGPRNSRSSGINFNPATTSTQVPFTSVAPSDNYDPHDIQRTFRWSRDTFTIPFDKIKTSRNDSVIEGFRQKARKQLSAHIGADVSWRFSVRRVENSRVYLITTLPARVRRPGQLVPWDLECLTVKFLGPTNSESGVDFLRIGEQIPDGHVATLWSGSNITISGKIHTIGLSRRGAVEILLSNVRASSDNDELTSVSTPVQGGRAGTNVVEEAAPNRIEEPAKGRNEPDQDPESIIKTEVRRWIDTWDVQGKFVRAEFVRYRAGRIELKPIESDEPLTQSLDDIDKVRRKEQSEFISAYQRHKSQPDAVVKIVQPPFDLTWNDDLGTALKKVQAIKSIESVELVYSGSDFLAQTRRNDVKEANLDELRRLFQEANWSRERDDSIDRTVPIARSNRIRILAQPVRFEEKGFSLEITFQWHPGLIRVSPRRAISQAKQLLGQDPSCYFPIFLSRVDLVLNPLYHDQANQIMADIERRKTKDKEFQAFRSGPFTGITSAIAGRRWFANPADSLPRNEGRSGNSFMTQTRPEARIAFESGLMRYYEEIDTRFRQKIEQKRMQDLEKAEADQLMKLEGKLRGRNQD
jgi:hypothetical protein